MSYFTLARQSNIFCPATDSLVNHPLLVSDISPAEGRLHWGPPKPDPLTLLRWCSSCQRWPQLSTPQSPGGTNNTTPSPLHKTVRPSDYQMGLGSQPQSLHTCWPWVGLFCLYQHLTSCHTVYHVALLRPASKLACPLKNWKRRVLGMVIVTNLIWLTQLLWKVHQQTGKLLGKCWCSQWFTRYYVICTHDTLYRLVTLTVCLLTITLIN